MISSLTRGGWLRVSRWLVPCFLAAVPLIAQTVPTRIHSEIDGADRATLQNSLHPLAQARFEAGRVAPGTRLEGISLVFNRSTAQQADLQALLAAQQNAASPLYHQWLTPTQFAARFGMAPSDLEKVKSWLQQQGFSVDWVARSRNMIRFSGNVGQVEAAFGTEIHYYNVNGTRHFAPNSSLTLPSALTPTVLSVRNLDDFRPQSHVRLNSSRRVKPNFTSSISGAVFFAPGDIATIYNVSPLYHSGYNGAGQSIAIVGQSAVQLSDLQNFQNAAGLAIKDPTLLLVPDTGTSTVVSGDETESDLDLEWSDAMAPGASIFFVYTGSSNNAGAFDALEYAVDYNIAHIVSSSYGTCEADLGGATLESTFQQAASQGQTIIAASGDDGSTDCYGIQGISGTQQEALAVDYPASSPYVTGMGGTEISTTADNGAYLTSGSAYWEAQGSSDILSSALQYIPEIAWNDDSPTNGLSAGGGGKSTLFDKPSWQAGVSGIPADGKRDVPDIAVNSAPDNPGYLFCTSDTSDWFQGQAASCNSGFRDASTGDLTFAGGTSFAAPIFSGMLAIINQKQNYTTGQGLINPTLYSLASNSGTYSAAFHDITSGNNNCLAGTQFCTGTAGYSAGAGYDQVTGLGTIDLANLASAWPASTTSTLVGTTTTIAASNSTPAINTSDTFTITVAADSGSTVPGGTLTLTIDGGTPVTGVALSANGTATYSKSFTTAGMHQIIAAYSGDSTHAASTGALSVNVTGTSSGSGSFALSSTGITVSQGSSGTSTITATPKNGYTGTIDLSFDTSNDSALQNLCYSFADTLSNGDGGVTITNASAVATQLSFDTNAVDCASAAAMQASHKHAFRQMHRVSSARARPGSTAHTAVAFAGLLLAGFLGRYARRFRALAAILLFAVVGMAVSACGSNASSSLSDPPKGSYTITVTGQDINSATIPTATTTFTLTIQ